MKTLIASFALVLFFTETTFAQRSPCGNRRTSCYDSAPFTASGMVHAISSPIVHANENAAVYYARGSGRTCDQAFKDGMKRMATDFDYLVCDGSIKCGTNGGAYLRNQRCTRSANGTYYAWVQCDNLYHSEYIAPQQQDQMSGFILLETLRKR